MNTYLKKHDNLLSVLSNYSENVKSQAILKEEVNIVRDSIAYYENEGLSLRENYENAKKNYNKIEEVHRNAQLVANDALKTAKNLSEGFTPEEKGFEKFQEKYNSLPKGDKALQKLWDELQMKVNCMSTADESEVREYEKGLNLIESLREKLEQKTPLIQNIKQRRETLFEEWINPLQDLVGKINKNFSDYFQSMGCAGEVEISKEKGDLSFSDYGLVIRVTYRKEDPLQELNRYVKKSVTISEI